MPDLKRTFREILVLSYGKARSFAAAAKKHHVNWRTVKACVANVESGQGLASKPRSGRPPILRKDECEACYDALTERKMDATAAALHLVKEGRISKRVNRKTVARAARKIALERGTGPLRVSRAKPKFRLTVGQKKVRLAFCIRHKRECWIRYLFTDKCTFCLDYPGEGVGCLQYLKKGEERQAYRASHPSVANLYGGLCRWGTTKAVLVTGTTGLHTDFYTKKGTKASGCTSMELEQVVLPALLASGQQMFGAHGIRYWTFQQDNDKIHKPTARVIRQYNKQHNTNIRYMDDWAAHSPDLSLIENIWGDLETQLRARAFPDFQSFKKAVISGFENYPKEKCRALFKSMRSRIQECINKGGDKTRH